MSYYLCQKTNTVYDELLLHSVKTPSSYLIIIGYLLLILNYLKNEKIIIYDFHLSSSIFILMIILISWSIQRGLNFYIDSKPFLKNISGEDDATLVTETYEIVIRIIKVIVVVIAILLIMQESGLSISSFSIWRCWWINSRFNAKDLLSNFFGGMMIFFDRPFKNGEFIKSPDRDIEGIVEKIMEINGRKNLSKNVLYIPNTAFSSIIVENATRMSNRRINETIEIRYDDLKKMNLILNDVTNALEKNSKIDQNIKPKVYFKSFAPSSCDFFVYAFTATKDWEEFLSIKQDILFEIAEIIENHNAEIAYPTSTVFINKN